jgi:DeoR family fructose operon transcriptional repressor
VWIREAADDLDVSEMTIRRDLQALEEMGVARRVRGGAVAVGPSSFVDRDRRQAQAKAKIAAKLLGLVPQTGAIALDASSTILRLATAVDGARDLTVLTNGFDTFHALANKVGLSAVLTGGERDPRTGSLVGPVAVRSAGTFLTTRLFMSAAGLDPHLGTSEAALEEAEVKLALARVTDEVVLAADATKLHRRSVAAAFPWEKVSVLVTELHPSDARLDPFRDLVDLR